MEYNFREIESKWISFWKTNGSYKVSEDSPGEKYYVLDMFPYPSGAGLHVGHPLGYIASDVIARYKKLLGYNVLHPMFEYNNNKRISEVRDVMCQTVREMRDPEGQPHLHGLRSLLTNFAHTRDQKYAFQIENEMGYLFYFLQEILKLFNADCTRALSPYRKNYSKLYVMEMEFCNSNTVEQCLENTYKDWTFDSNIANNNNVN